MNFRFSKRSREKLVGVRPQLVTLAELALAKSPVDFAVTEGLRTVERQRALVAAGASKTMNSKHLDGRAIDVGAFVGPQLRWDFGLYIQIAEAFQRASAELGVPVRWGGSWYVLTRGLDVAGSVSRYTAACKAANKRPLLDGPHFELA